jgi:hypothetical protein
MSIPTTATLRRSSRRLDKRNIGVAAVIRAMRAGAHLHLEYHQAGPKWRMSTGQYVADAIARVVIAHKQIIPAGDALFAGAMSQTWKWKEDAGA